MKQRTELKRITGLKRSTKPIKRTALARATTAPKRGWIVRRKTKRLRDYEDEFEAMKPLVRARSRGRCETADYVTSRMLTGAEATPLEQAALLDYLTVPCRLVGQHVHHRKYRARRGSNALVNLMDTCVACHNWIHAHGKMSNALGLSLRAEESEDRQ